MVHTTSRFNRRVTCIEWNDAYPHIVAFGSHAGDIHLCDTTNSDNDIYLEGVSIDSSQSVRICNNNLNFLYQY